MSVLSGVDFWQSAHVLKPVAVGSATYLVAYAAFRVLGNRSVASLTIVGFILSVSVGSIISSLAILPSVPLVTGLLALATILLWELLLTRLVVHFPALRRIITSDPVLLYYDSVFLLSKLRRARICRADIFTAMREDSKANFDNVHAMVLETTGKISIVASAGPLEEYPVLSDVPGYPPSLEALLKETADDEGQRYMRGDGMK